MELILFPFLAWIFAAFIVFGLIMDEVKEKGKEKELTHKELWVIIANNLGVAFLYTIIVPVFISLLYLIVQIWG